MSARLWRPACLGLAALLLAGCAGPAPASSQGETPPAASNGVEEHWSVLGEREERLPAVGSRWSEGPMEEVTPGPDYGELVPFIGAVCHLYYPGEDDTAFRDTYPTYLYGLMTADGQVVLDPVCTSCIQMSYDLESGGAQALPVWKLIRGDPSSEAPFGGELVALSALDGSWATPFQYRGAIGSPVGVFAGDSEGLALLDTAKGEEKRAWTWTQLGIDQPEYFPWLTGDAYTAAHWEGGRLYLGVWGEEGETALLLEPESGAVTSMPAQEWYQHLETLYSQRTWEGWVDVSASEGGTVTVSRGEASYTFPSPLPAVYYPYAIQDRVIFQDYVFGRLAVTTLEGETVLPAQEGQLAVVETNSGNYLAVQSEADGDWQLYNWEGRPGAILPGGPDSACQGVGPLVEVRSLDCAAYYRPDTGECVFRTWFTLEDRMEPASAP